MDGVAEGVEEGVLEGVEERVLDGVLEMDGVLDMLGVELRVLDGVLEILGVELGVDDGVLLAPAASLYPTPHPRQPIQLSWLQSTAWFPPAASYSLNAFEFVAWASSWV